MSFFFFRALRFIGLAAEVNQQMPQLVVDKVTGVRHDPVLGPTLPAPSEGPIQAIYEERGRRLHYLDAARIAPAVQPRALTLTSLLEPPEPPPPPNASINILVCPSGAFHVALPALENTSTLGLALTKPLLLGSLLACVKLPIFAPPLYHHDHL